MIAFIVIAGIIAIATVIFLNTERFGRHPSGEDLKEIAQSKNYKDGSFQNILTTPMLSEGVGYYEVLKEFFFSSKPKEPSSNIPSSKTDLKKLNPEENVLVWMGHSTYFMQLDGKTILVDPVLSGYASPLFFTTKAFKGTDIYTVEDFPAIDYLFLTHDHWDHMDYNTLKELKPKIKKVITGLGNGSHIKRWGFSQETIVEGDWYDSIVLDTGFTAHVTPARHFSGRGFTRGKTLWASFVISSKSANIYLGGDSGYGPHFKEIGNKFGPFDLAILENGQYDEKWKNIHMLPGEQLLAAADLGATSILPVHAAKFTLANHDWNEPLEKISKASKSSDLRIITPKIGDKVNLMDKFQVFENWWQ